MRILDTMIREGVEQIVVLSDPSCGLAGFMVLHDTTRGPATGGIRVYPYQTEEAALADAIRLARAMTLKTTAADLPVGGGKIVLIDNADLVRKEALGAVGRVIESLRGRFLAGRDVGVPVHQGAWVRQETGYMVDESENGVGDLNRATALGVEAGARAALAFVLGTDRWLGVRVALQGAGGVGRWLARLLASQGAELFVADLQPDSLEALAQEVRFQAVSPEEIYTVASDLFCPCAIGGVVNDRTVNRLTARAVAGSANHVLSEPRMGWRLFERGIAYAPDYLINAGALIQGVHFLLSGERHALTTIECIGERTRRLLETAARVGEPPEVVLERETLARLPSGRTWRRWSWPDV